MRVQGPPKRQHYLPAVYLKQFSPDGPQAHRTSPIWRLDEKSHKEVSVESQCHKPFFYSHSNAAGAEQFFAEIETLYGQLATLIWSGQQNRSTKDYFGLMLFMISVHLRNPAYEVRLRGPARIEIYKLLEQQFVHHVLMGGSDGVPTPEQLLEILKTKWRVKLLSTPTGETLITSDNPALWFSCDESGDVHFMVLPITPNCCAVAFDCTVLRVKGTKFTARDVTLMNRGQVQSMLKVLFSHAPFSEEDQRAAPTVWEERKQPEGFIDATEWQMNVLRYSDRLSFIEGPE